jgi:hypothetical protein
MESATRLSYETPGDGGASEQEKGQVNGGALVVSNPVVSNPKASELVDPGNRSLDHRRCRPRRSLESMPRWAMEGKHFHPKGNMPSKFTIGLQNGLRESLPFDDKRDAE